MEEPGKTRPVGLFGRAEGEFVREKLDLGRYEDDEPLEAGQGPLSPQEHDRLEDPGTGRAAGNPYPHCMDEGPWLHATLFCRSSHRQFHMWVIEWCSVTERRQERAEVAVQAWRTEVLLYRLLVVLDGISEKRPGLPGEVRQALGARPQQLEQTMKPRRRGALADDRPETCFLEEWGDLRRQGGDRQARDVLPVHPIKLRRVEHGVPAADALQGESGDELLPGHELAIVAR